MGVKMELIIFGNVQTVLDGISDKKTKEIDLSTIPFALGAGLYADKDFGETIVVNGIAHVHTVDGVRSYDKTLDTPFLMGFSQKPSERVELQNEKTIDQFYTDLLAKHPEGVVLYAEVTFSKLEAAFLKKSPVYEENCNLKKEEYWQEYSAQNVQGTLVGIIAKKAYKEGFYVNPNDKGTLLSHTHVLCENKAYHLLTQSVLSEGKFSIAPIEDVRLRS